MGRKRKPPQPSRMETAIREYLAKKNIQAFDASGAVLDLAAALDIPALAAAAMNGLIGLEDLSGIIEQLDIGQIDLDLPDLDLTSVIE
ncbi:hypothetical protein FACS189483_02750 [Spirochaetia bacterium]|nr:hypothetical protein FACS189483_02750 [Spirochaetia bacterium]